MIFLLINLPSIWRSKKIKNEQIYVLEAQLAETKSKKQKLEKKLKEEMSLRKKEQMKLKVMQQNEVKI